MADIQPDNGQLELQANARQPDSSVTTPTGGSGGGKYRYAVGTGATEYFGTAFAEL